jgi:hypothetical protein
MKGKYITLQIRMACLSQQAKAKKDIHMQLEETIAERKRIMQQLENFSRRARVVDMYLYTTKAA